MLDVVHARFDRMAENAARHVSDVAERGEVGALNLSSHPQRDAQLVWLAGPSGGDYTVGMYAEDYSVVKSATQHVLWREG